MIDKEWVYPVCSKEPTNKNVELSDEEEDDSTLLLKTY